MENGFEALMGSSSEADCEMEKNEKRGKMQASMKCWISNALHKIQSLKHYHLSYLDKII